ncbi:MULTISPECIES: methylated-DNA--[protein]-cysteine S-methyltransferase [Micromonospora]|uniref:methylated-DNA--[protein]-cysteine S-methyltransferase n=1 Tax=Micromonospora TaxID=1873 RepID=UPI001EE8B2DC|nr:MULTISPECIES: methylated-DNA--[protein]-cysteine S-methyltransferase [Micromonospora]MCG5453622.1 methylated-DNA--[protein]-cysteine S-methyltransferase [Micromonospora hortensis]MCX5120503.1 methylated-DNA--[protein]-cysteine S-methyltransferase [Micromonospora sp. NBC_00362]WTI07540.1 methylated-DNA--[protein]-cysteine S-methyltransferase [Micromonospora sp. NBC_00821]
MNIDSTVLSTPAGPLSILAGPDGDVRAAGFTPDPAALLPLVHPALRAPLRERADLGPVSAAVHSYLDGDLAAIDTVPVRQRTGGEFMAHAWQVLREVPPGTPVTYTGYAALAGRPPAVRAAAAACARNAAALFVPCHRVLRTDGTLGGYRWGLDVKKWLLGHERRLTTS